jgi:hypothetical protein
VIFCYSHLDTISFPEPAILTKECEALVKSIVGRQESWLRPNCIFHINSQSDSSLKRFILEPHIPSRGSQAWGTRLPWIMCYLPAEHLWSLSEVSLLARFPWCSRDLCSQGTPTERA